MRCLLSLVVLLFAAAGSVHSAPTDLALQPSPVITSPGPQYGPGTRPFQGIPGIERAPGGRLWATWYSGGPDEGPENYVMLSTSADDGRSWSGVKLVIDPPGPIRAYDPCLWRAPDGHLWLFWAQAHTWWDGRAGVWAISTGNSDAETPEWSAPRRLCDGIMMNKPTVLSTGEWVLSAAVWNVSTARITDPAARHDPGERHRHESGGLHGPGATWTRRGQARVPERTFDESMLVERKDGSLWLLVRTKYGIGESVSTDHGRTWSPGQPSSIPHINTRFSVRRLKSGRLLLARHDPPEGSTRRSHLKAYLSEDDGQTWKGGLLLDERVGVSYPDAVEAPDGTLYLIYDFDRKGARQILLTTFTEEDVLAAKPISNKLRSRALINQAVP